MQKVSHKAGAPLPALVSIGAAFAVFAGIAWWESRRALRGRAESRLVHTTRNIAVAGLAAGTVHLCEAPVVNPVAMFVMRRRLGLLRRLGLPGWLDVALAALLMDYTLYIWHILVHRIPALWRFHIVHHTDLDLDVSTALRFHFGELLVSIPWRVGQIALIGTTPRALSVWQTATLISIMFHHSNIALPLGIERVLAWMVVTPRMHGIHHSIVPSEVNSNWSSGLTLWDRLHRTFRLDVPSSDVVIGVPAYRAPDDVSLGRILVLPFATPADVVV